MYKNKNKEMSEIKWRQIIIAFKQDKATSLFHLEFDRMKDLKKGQIKGFGRLVHGMI